MSRLMAAEVCPAGDGTGPHEPEGQWLGTKSELMVTNVCVRCLGELWAPSALAYMQGMSGTPFALQFVIEEEEEPWQ